MRTRPVPVVGLGLNMCLLTPGLTEVGRRRRRATVKNRSRRIATNRLGEDRRDRSTDGGTIDRDGTKDRIMNSRGNGPSADRTIVLVRPDRSGRSGRSGKIAIRTTGGDSRIEDARADITNLGARRPDRAAVDDRPGRAGSVTGNI